MDRTERFYHIDRLLNERGVVPLEDFLHELEVSRATFKRDLEYLRERFNAPIVWDRDAGGYRFDRAGIGPRYELPGLWFNASEVFALLSMQQLLKSLEPGLLSAHVEPLLTRLRAILGSEGSFAIEDIEQRIHFHRHAARSHDTRHFTPIATAVLQRRRIAITHHARARDETTRREISPQRLSFYREVWYVDAWCHLREGLRSFALDAISAVTPLGVPAHEVDEDSLRTQLDSGYGIFSGAEVDWAELEFTPERARWVSRETWHRDQSGHFTASGHYRLRLPFSDPTELGMDILRHMPEVRVLAPARLRKHVRQKLEQGLKQA